MVNPWLVVTKLAGLAKHFRVARVSLALLLTLAACAEKTTQGKSVLEEIRAEGELVVLTRNAPTTYFLGRDGFEGFEYDLAKSFAAHLGLPLKVLTLDTTSEVLQAIAQNEGHLAAAGLTRTEDRARSHLFGPDYLKVHQEVVCGKRKSVPRNLPQLAKRSLMVVADSSYEERLGELQRYHQELTWTASFDWETEQILEAVWRDELDCTVADSNIVDIYRRYYPELRVPFSITGDESLAWVLAPRYERLLDELERWMARIEEDGSLEQIRERYYGYVQIFDYADIRTYQRRIRSRLPRIEVFLKKASETHGFAWPLLAAQAYQESHWVASATSPTGVRGIMMLTQKTAGEMGVEDRTDPEQSIAGGTAYLAQVYEALPESIVEPDRTWIALAAYNVGRGHVDDARTLAVRQGLNPNLWSDLRQILPLLTKKAYYKTVRFGYARGWEPVRYVQRIRNFQDILERQIQQQLLAEND